MLYLCSSRDIVSIKQKCDFVSGNIGRFHIYFLDFKKRNYKEAYYMNFSVKLKEIMNKNHLSAKDIAILMCNYGSNKDLWETKDPKEKKNLIDKINKWKGGRATPGNLNDLELLCCALDCDCSYLLDDSQIQNVNNKIVADYLGVDEAIVSSIKNYDDTTKGLLYKLISNSSCDNLKKLLQSIYIYSLEAHHANVRLDVVGADILQTQNVEDDLIGNTNTKKHTLPEISKKMLRYSVNSVLEEVLNSTYKDYVDEANTLLKERLNEKAEIEKKRCSRIYKKIYEGNKDMVTIDEWNLILGNKWTDNPIPTEEECHNRIDEKYNHFYDICKEQNE